MNGQFPAHRQNSCCLHHAGVSLYLPVPCTELWYLLDCSLFAWPFQNRFQYKPGHIKNGTQNTDGEQAKAFSFLHKESIWTQLNPELRLGNKEFLRSPTLNLALRTGASGDICCLVEMQFRWAHPRELGQCYFSGVVPDGAPIPCLHSRAAPRSLQQ